MPFGLIVGVNSHFQSVIFAGVLLREEKVENFEWLFREFVKMMSGKNPLTILTGNPFAIIYPPGRCVRQLFLIISGTALFILHFFYVSTLE
jgi:hypothetical protein